MDSSIYAFGNFWYSGQLYKVKTAKYVNEQAEVVVEPENQELVDKLRLQIEDPKGFHTIKVGWQGSYTYFPEDEAAFSAWLYPRR
jgi:hypothetical protein